MYLIRIKFREVFFLWDLSQAIFTVYMLEHAGMPGTGASVPEANRKQF